MSLDPRRIHAHVMKTTNRSDRSSLNHLITLYSKSNLFTDALRIFRQIPSPNVISWTALISGNSNSFLSLHHLISMLRHPVLPNQRTLASLFKTCAILSIQPFGLQLHSLAVKLCLSTEAFCGSALVSFYCKCRIPDVALKMFDEIHDKDEVCYGAIIDGLTHNSRSNGALSLFSRMRMDGVLSTMYSVSGALGAAADLTALDQCMIIHGHSVVTGLDRNGFVCTALIHGYGKCGLILEARRAFDALLPIMNVVGWNAIMAPYAQQADTCSVLELFNSMVSRGITPDQCSFLAILTAFSNAGLPDETQQWLTRMRLEYGLAPWIEHYTCLVGALGRVGKLAEAERIAMNMSFKPDAGVWRTLLSASAVHGDAEMARRMCRHLLELDQHDDSAYVIAANAFSASGRQKEATELRNLMVDGKVRKEGGRSWIEVQGEMHMFLAGDKSHERRDNIYKKLAELMEEITKLGYVPNGNEMLHDVEEGDKIEGLWCHSEKLALAFGVLNGIGPPGRPLRIVKNLRICADCHEAFKYFSRVLDKEILVRDVNRYHRFLNGSCNCGDFW